MPTLDWIGKKAVVNHHREVPFHLLKCDPALSVGDPGNGNLLVQADNLLALKALLPYYAGRVKCIYIDPPYNTGNENWVYNDAVNSQEIRKWLGKVVGAEAEDLSRHDKWLCMMHPRLALLRKFLSRDGVIFVSIDDHEVHHLRCLMDEVFGPRQFVTMISWQKVYTVKNSAKQFSEMHDHLVVYAPQGKDWIPNLLGRTSKQDDAYSNPDNDSRGPWKATPVHARNPYNDGLYEILSPSGKTQRPPTGTYWRFAKATFDALDADKRIWWGEDGSAVPARKTFLSEVKQGVVPATMWFHQQAGHNAEAKNELRELLGTDDLFFTTPKPVRLLRRILELATDTDSIVLDSFAGTGTTGQAVLEQNASDGGSRRFILVEMDTEVARRTLRARMQRVVTGEGWFPKQKRLLFEVQLTAARLLSRDELGQKVADITKEYSGQFDDVSTEIEDTSLRVYGIRRTSAQHPGLGSGFRYCTLGVPLFSADGSVSGDVGFAALAAHVYFAETGEPIPKPDNRKSPHLGIHNGKAVYLLFNGILGDRTPDGGNVLTGAVLASLPPHDGPRVIYGEGCRLGATRLKRERIVFKQIPYEIKVS